VRAVLVPHAGYVYSGEVAAACFREVDPGFRRAFILAANHNGEADFSGVSIPDVTHYAIPGAEIPLSPVVDDLREESLFTSVPAAHTMHMIEVELPFLQHLRGRADPPDFSIVPMIAGRMDTEAIERLTTRLESFVGPETLYVFSVDLSHFYPDETARRLDGDTISAVMALDVDSLADVVTDGNRVLQTMVSLARRRGWEATYLCSRNSGEVSGDQRSVVGYAAIALHEPLRLSKEEEGELLAHARASILGHLREGLEVDGAERLDVRERESWLDEHPVFRLHRGVFVTLEKDGELRGCIGETTPRQPLHLAVRSCAIKSATSDTRFPPVIEEELEELQITISILGYPTLVHVADPERYLEVLRPLRDGVILVHQGRRSTFLPQVWEALPDPEQFLSRLCIKQGSPPDAWRSPETQLYRYGALVFGED